MHWNGILDKLGLETLQELLYDSNFTLSGCYLRNFCKKKISFVIETIFIICIILCEIQFIFFLNINLLLHKKNYVLFLRFKVS